MICIAYANQISASKASDMNVPDSSTTRRTILFVDYQNMYRSAREAFGWESEGGHFGNFPVRTASGARWCASLDVC